MSARPIKNRTVKPKGGSPVADEVSKTPVSKTPGPFDVPTVEALVALMSEHDLSEIDLRSGEQRITLRRGAAPVVAPTPAAPVLQMPAAPTPTVATPSAPPKPDSAPATAGPARKLVEIKSITPGTFYSSPSPDAQPFVRMGSKVTPTTVVWLIEPMKLFNEITAECNGVIAEVLVEN